MTGFAVIRINREKQEKEYRAISREGDGQTVYWSFDPNQAMNCAEDDAKVIRDQLRKSGDKGFAYHREFLDD